MKTILLALSLFLPAAVAEPVVGQFISVEWRDLSTDETWSTRNELISYDATAESFTNRISVYEQGQLTDTFTDSMSKADLLYWQDESIKYMADCSGHGGQLETVTVPAGTFQACAVREVTDGKTDITWYMPGPFEGMIKARLETLGVEFELREFN